MSQPEIASVVPEVDSHRRVDGGEDFPQVWPLTERP
jgi:hypothetical protein